jgi:hypothetical protein
MKIEAKSRLSASTMLECGCVSAKVCAHSVSALTEKQKKLDINKNGKIDADDLKKVREGELSEATSVESALVTEDVAKKFMSSLFRHANLKKFGLVLRSTQIDSVSLLKEGQLNAVIDAIKKVGFPKMKGGAVSGNRYIRLSTEDGKWPITILILSPISGGKEGVYLRITIGTHDTLDKSERKSDKAVFKAIADQAVKALGVSPKSKEAYNTGYSVEIRQPNNVGIKDAFQKLKPIFGTPKKESSGVGMFTKNDSVDTTSLTFKGAYGFLVLKWVNGSNQLENISVRV